MRIDGLAAGQINISNNGADVLNKLKAGDVVRAQILENNGDELTLKLSDGSTVSANAMTAINAKEGDFVNFVFKGMEDGKLILESAGKSVPQIVNEVLENAKSALTSIKLPLTDENIEMAIALQKQNLPVTSETITKLSDMVNTNDGLKADAAAFLIAAKMSDDMNNIDKLQSLLAGRLKITDNISGLIKLIESAKGSETPKAVSGVINQLAGLLKENNEALPVKAAVIGALLEKLSAEMESKVGNSAGTVQTDPNIPQNNNSNQSVTPNNSPSGSVEPGTNKPGQIPSEQNGTSANTTNATAAGNPTETDIEQAAKASVGSNAPQPAVIVSTDGEKTHTVNSNSQGITNSEENHIPLGKADLPVLKELRSQLQSLADGKRLTSEQLTAAKFIAGEIDKTIKKIEINQHELDNFRIDAGKQRVMEEAENTLKNLFVKIGRDSDDINPVRLYKELDGSLTTVKNAIQQLPAALREAAVNIANNLESNVNFINQLNNYSSYVQLPLSIFSKNTTGELYMLKKGSKARKLDPSNLTVLISLDSNHIGRIDTLLSINKKDVSTNFRLEDSKVFKVLKDNHKMLYNSLLEKGYRLVDFTYKLLEEPLSIVNFEEEAKKEFIKTPNNIDILI
ncbi:MAG TPA: hypothetical protein VHP38_05435 [Ruminiclostridium sp.]|nr:hypothetical protein [Ruminiclostridium sp.]